MVGDKFSIYACHRPVLTSPHYGGLTQKYHRADYSRKKASISVTDIYHRHQSRKKLNSGQYFDM